MGSAKTANRLMFLKPVKYIVITAIAGAFALVLQSCGAETGGDSLAKYKDDQGPALSFRCPVRLAERVGAKATISFDISDSGAGVDETLITSAIFSLKDSTGNDITGAFTYAGGTVTFVPASDLPDETYTASVAGIQDKIGNTTSSSSWKFTVDTANAASATDTGIPVCPAKDAGGGGGAAGGYGPKG